MTVARPEAPAAKTLSAIRLSLFYAAFFAVVGVHLPFWPVWLASRGIGATEIGIILAATVSAKVVSAPMMAHVADRWGERRRLMILCAAGALAGFTLFAVAGGFWSILGISILFSVFWSAIMPLGESLTMLTARARGLDYGRVRLWGSLSFIAAAVAAGRILAGRPEDIVFWLLIGGIAVTLAACTGLPDTRTAPVETARLPIGLVLRNRTFVLFLASVALIQGSHSVYYAFGTLHWRAAGYSDDLIGWLWAEGVIAEIVLFAFGGVLVRRFGPANLIILGGLAGIVRWCATGLSDALPVLVAVQALHAFTFGATHLGAIHFIARTVPPALSATAQSLYSAAVMGLGLGLAILASGSLYAAFGAGAYFAMAVLGALGSVCAVVLARRWRT